MSNRTVSTCKHCRERFTPWLKGKYYVRKSCHSCFVKSAKENGARIKELWRLGLIKKSVPVFNHTNKGVKNINRFTNCVGRETLINRFVQCSTYLVLGHQKGLCMVYGICSRNLRLWLNKFYPGRKKYGKGGRKKSI